MCRASGAAGGRPPIAARSFGRMPSSASRVSEPFRCGISTGTWYRRWNARSSASEAAYCSQRSAVRSSSSSRVAPISAATASAAASMPAPAHGSRAKLSSTQCEVTGAPPMALGAGQVICGPLEIRSVVTTSCVPAPAATCPAAACSAATLVAHAWATIGPVTPGAPSRAARVGAP